MTKRRKLSKKLVLSVATLGSAANWRDPSDNSREFSKEIDGWIKLAKLAEKGKFHCLFIIDHLSWFDVYGQSHDAAARLGVNAARISPGEVVSALSLATESLGIGVTFSTVSEHPYHFARRLASLDHLTKGRIGWNIVSSYLPSISGNLLDGEPLLEHDERYVKTAEYLDVVSKLLLSSWRDDAIVYDRKNGLFADPSAIREIGHEGKYFRVSGPAITEPSPQRLPLLIQAGSSRRGRLFAAENAELIFLPLEDDSKTAEIVSDVRHLAEKRFQRDAYSIKFILAVNIFVGRTHEEAVAKRKLFEKYDNKEASLVYFGGTTGIDVADLAWDEIIPSGKTNGIQGKALRVQEKRLKKRQLLEQQQKDWTRFVGTATEVADALEDIVSVTDVDGFNFALNSFPGGFEDIVELLIPELQRRGLAQENYTVPGGTFRENLYAKKGQTFLPNNHPAFNLRWQQGVDKSTFEKQLEERLQNISSLRNQF